MSKEIIFSYNKLWKLMVDKNYNKTQLKDKAQISTNAVAKLSKNESVSMETLGKICRALGCDIGDIVEINFMIDEREDKNNE